METFQLAAEVAARIEARFCVTLWKAEAKCVRLGRSPLVAGSKRALRPSVVLVAVILPGEHGHRHQSSRLEVEDSQPVDASSALLAEN